MLWEFKIPIEEIIGSGGGETKGTQRLRNALHQQGWRKHSFIVQRIIDGIEREAQSHEVEIMFRYLPPEPSRWRSNERRRQAKLARSAGASPAQVKP